MPTVDWVLLESGKKKKKFGSLHLALRSNCNHKLPGRSHFDNGESPSHHPHTVAHAEHLHCGRDKLTTPNLKLCRQPLPNSNPMKPNL